MKPDELPLRDIHLPEPVSWWPPAPGWWILLVTAGALVAIFFWWRRRRRARMYAPATLARAELEKLKASYAEHGDVQQLLRDISIWLRRASMALSSRREVASLTGVAWQQRLADMAGEAVFAGDDSKLLIEAAYRDTLPAGTTADGAHLLALCERWIDATTHRLKSR
jgi:hypothetical protein